MFKMSTIFNVCVSCFCPLVGHAIPPHPSDQSSERTHLFLKALQRSGENEIKSCSVTHSFSEFQCH